MASEKHESPVSALNNIVRYNPILVQAVGLCPAVAVAVSLKVSAIIALISAIVLVFSEFITSLLFKTFPRKLRIGLYIIIGGMIMCPMMLVIEKLYPDMFSTLGIYLPVMAVNSLIVLRCERFAARLSPVNALKDGITASIGYGLIIILIGAFREILGSGSIGGYELWEGKVIPAMLLPCGGFIILGFGSAIVRFITSNLWPHYLDAKQPKPDLPKKPSPAPAEAVIPEASADESDESVDFVYDQDAFNGEETDRAADTKDEDAPDETEPAPENNNEKGGSEENDN